jgi:hypothetical protein
VQPVSKITESIYDASPPSAHTEVLLEKAQIPAGTKLVAQFSAYYNQRALMFKRAQEIGATHVLFEEDSTVVPGSSSQRITVNTGPVYGGSGYGGGFAGGVQSGKDAMEDALAGPRRFYSLTCYAFRITQ